MYGDYLCIVTADTPTMIECIRFPGRKKRINIPQAIGPKYYQFGILLLDDPNGTRLRSIIQKYMGDSEQISTEILKTWIDGEGKKPVTWKTLVQVLRDIDLHTLPKKIEEVKLVSVEIPKEEVQLPLETHFEGMCTWLF